eukprot:14167553-Heterocapsa_arctica.AAC.1
MKDDEPSKCVYLESEDVAEPVDKDAARDEGTCKRTRCANTSRPIGVSTDVWKNMSHAERTKVT